MNKKLMGVLVGLVILLPLLAACAGPPGSPGQPGLPGNPGQPGLQGPPGEPAPQQLASIVVIPASGTQKTSITVIGTGFTPGEEVEVEVIINGQSTLVGYREKIEGVMKEKHVVNEFGTFKVVSAIPRAVVVSPGVYTVKATDTAGTVAIAPLQVVE